MDGLVVAEAVVVLLLVVVVVGVVGGGGCRDGGGGGGLWTWKVMDGDDGMRDGDGKMGKTNGRQFLKSTCTAGVRGRLQHTGSSHDLVGGQYQYQCHIV